MKLEIYEQLEKVLSDWIKVEELVKDEKLEEAATKAKAQQTECIALLESAAGRWAQLIEVTKRHYNPIPAVQISHSQNNPDAVFSWQRYSNQVKRDIQIAKAAN